MPNFPPKSGGSAKAAGRFRLLQKETVMTVSRRMILQSAGAAIPLMLGAGASHAVPVKAPKHWDETFDFVILGAGGAGLACGIEAVERKQSAVILEKMPFIGGASAICGGQWSAAGTAFQKERGIKDDAEHFLANMLKIGGYANDPALVKAFIEESLNHYNWVTSRGVMPKSVYAPSGMDVARAHLFDPQAVITLMADYVKKGGVQIRTREAGERLIQDPETGRIIGVRAKTKAGVRFYRAKKGVLLATGGYCHNPKMLQRFVPTMKEAAVVAAPGATGDGINMAMQFGADTLDTGYVRASFGYKPNPKTVNDFSLVQFSGAILVNKLGRRYADESLSYKELGTPTLDQPDGMGFAIFNDKIRKAAMAVWSGDADMLKPIDEGCVPDYIHMGATLEEALKKAHLPVRETTQTLKRYNEDLKAGKESLFNRTTLSSGFGKAFPIEDDGRWYVFPLTSGLMSTCAGVRINTKAQVIDLFGDVIPGLYAAGEMTGGIHGAAYMTGTAFGKAMAYGRIAGRAMAQERA